MLQVWTSICKVLLMECILTKKHSHHNTTYDSGESYNLTLSKDRDNINWKGSLIYLYFNIWRGLKRDKTCYVFLITVEPRYSELMGGVICSDSEMFGLSEKKKCTYANTALGFPATRQSTVAMRECGNVENIMHNVITVHSCLLVLVLVSTVVQRS